MGFDRIRIKENAKKHVSLNRWNNVLVVLAVNIIGLLCTFTLRNETRLFGGGKVTNLVFFGIFKVNALLVPLSLAFIVPLVGFALQILVTNVLSIGTAGWFTKTIRSEKLPVSNIFEPFKKNYADNLLTVFLTFLYTFLWMLLFIVPGIVKAYSYSLAPYIKAENPNIPAKRCIELSMAMMDGHKMDMFILQLSFIGWNILSAMTFEILGLFYVAPYYRAALAFAYEEIKADAAARGVIDINEITQQVEY